ncbi:uncharacterized protein LOC119665009, partial [Teleopsis dalmanni]|uniref:uncharacterized protein LOC119665009 n=1 Tax=Teleopsis dalmanni TaxID=139649 RepID=UPI0018CDFDC9
LVVAVVEGDTVEITGRIFCLQFSGLSGCVESISDVVVAVELRLLTGDTVAADAGLVVTEAIVVVPFLTGSVLSAALVVAEVEGDTVETSGGIFLFALNGLGDGCGELISDVAVAVELRLLTGDTVVADAGPVVTEPIVVVAFLTGSVLSAPLVVAEVEGDTVETTGGIFLFALNGLGDGCDESTSD